MTVKDVINKIKDVKSAIKFVDGPAVRPRNAVEQIHDEVDSVVDMLQEYIEFLENLEVKIK